jgi:hypothetical protein
MTFRDPLQFYSEEAIAERYIKEMWDADDLHDRPLEPLRPVVRLAPKIGRNDLWPCGSGKKYKKYCLSKPALNPNLHDTRNGAPIVVPSGNRCLSNYAFVLPEIGVCPTTPPTPSGNRCLSNYASVQLRLSVQQRPSLRATSLRPERVH